ncbi:hypothetical protein [Chryseobacterium gambrini]|uniref:hypothetical protein n=1 Tax=Chryseobacterium gambrini TaxID=373672 RepID=UPI003D0B485B
MLDQTLVEETIQDIKYCKEKILERHEGDTTFTLRVDTVFNQLINSLAYTTGNVVPEQRTGKFQPKPLQNVLGTKIHRNSESTPKLEPLDVDKANAVKEQIQLIYDSFPNREDAELLENLKDWQIKGVAKVAGLQDYDTTEIDGDFIRQIKDKIQANKDEAAAKDLKKDELSKGSTAKTADAKKATDKTNPAK